MELDYSIVWTHLQNQESEPIISKSWTMHQWHTKIAITKKTRVTFLSRWRECPALLHFRVWSTNTTINLSWKKASEGMLGKSWKLDAKVSLRSTWWEMWERLNFFVRYSDTIANSVSEKQHLNACLHEVGQSAPRWFFDLHDRSGWKSCFLF